jgi:hypothetical protein
MSTARSEKATRRTRWRWPNRRRAASAKPPTQITIEVRYVRVATSQEKYSRSAIDLTRDENIRWRFEVDIDIIQMEAPAAVPAELLRSRTRKAKSFNSGATPPSERAARARSPARRLRSPLDPRP